VGHTDGTDGITAQKSILFFCDCVTDLRGRLGLRRYPAEYPDFVCRSVKRGFCDEWLFALNIHFLVQGDRYRQRTYERNEQVRRSPKTSSLIWPSFLHDCRKEKLTIAISQTIAFSALSIERAIVVLLQYTKYGNPVDEVVKARLRENLKEQEYRFVLETLRVARKNAVAASEEAKEDARKAKRTTQPRTTLSTSLHNHLGPSIPPDDQRTDRHGALPRSQNKNLSPARPKDPNPN